MELVEVDAEEMFIIVLRFAGKGDLLGGEAVFASVLGDLPTTGGGDGAGGFGGVGAIGFCFAHLSSRGREHGGGG